jgi:transcriptional regulator GlxA family with amidase domain
MTKENKTHSVKLISTADKELNICINYIISNYEEPLSLSSIAAEAGISEWAASRRFQTHLKTSPMRWVWSFRTTLAAECIKLAPDWPLTDISVLTGFTSLAHFSRHFKNQFNEPPSRYKSRQIRNQQVLCQTDHSFMFEDLVSQRQDILYHAANIAIAE